MAINPPAHNAAQAGRPRLRKSLKLWQVVMMGLAFVLSLCSSSDAVVARSMAGSLPAGLPLDSWCSAP